jgi:broad specificity phosphatase PhoE
VQGRTDNPLNDVGRGQARAAALLLPDAVDVIYVSPLMRARETAEIINGRYGVGTVVDERLIERDFGIYEGVYFNEVDINIGAMRRWTDNAATPGGEAIREVAARVHRFLGDIIKEGKFKTAVVVAHAHVIRTMFWYFNGVCGDDGAEREIVLETGGVYFFG